MTKAQEMLAKAGLPDTKQGRAAFHKMYPTPDDFFKVHGNIFKHFPELVPMKLPIKPENVLLEYSPEKEYYLQDTSIGSSESDEDTDESMYRRGGPVMYGNGGKLPQGILRSRLEAHMSPSEAQSYINSYAQGGTVDALQLMGMPTPPMYGEGSFTSNPYNRFRRKGRNTGDDNITGFSTGFTTNYKLPGNYSSSGQSANVGQAATPEIGIGTRINGLDYTKDLYSDNNLSLGAGLTLGRGEQDRGSLFRTFNYTTPHGTPGTGFTQVANPENKTFMTGTLHGNANAHIPLGTASWGAQRQGRRNIGAGGVEIAGLNASLEAGLDKFGKGKINPYYDASVGLGMLNNMFNINAGYTNRTGNLQVGLPSGSTAVDTQKGRPYLGVDVQAPLYIDNKGNTRFKVFGGYGAGRGDNSGYAGATYTFANGGPITNYSPSSNFGAVLSKNNSYMHGFANGGPVGMYDFGSTIKDIGAGAYGVGEGLLDTVTMGLTDPLTDAGYNALQKVGGSTEAEMRQQNSLRGYGTAVGAATGIAINPGATWTGVGQGTKGLAQGVSEGSRDSQDAQNIAKGFQFASTAANMVGGAKNLSGAKGAVPTQSVTPSGINFGTGMPGGDLSNFGIGFAAMGGAVNAPNMLKYDDGGMTQQGPTQINVERGELLVDNSGKILTEYRGGGMTPHPADGSMDPRGTVPAQEGQFVITKRLAPNYKAAMENNDRLYATAMRNNISFDKQRKEAKQQAAQQAQQEMMQDMMMAKFGGLVGQYGYGGGVMKYDGGGNTPPGPREQGYSYNFEDVNPDNFYDFDPSTPFNIMNVGTYRPNIYPSPNAYGNPAATPVYNVGNLTGYTPTNFRMPSVGAPNKNAFITSQVYGSNPNTSYGPWNAQNAPTSPIAPTTQDLQDSQGPLGNRSYYDFPDTPDVPSNTPTNNTYTPTGTGNVTNTTDSSWFNRNKEDLGNIAGKAMLYGPGLYNLGRGIFDKAFQMNAADYQVKGRVNPYEEEYRPDYRTYNAAVANLNRMPGSGNLAARTNLFNAMQQQQDDARYKISLANAQRKMGAQQANLGIEGQNLSTSMNIAQFNEQNKAAKRNMLGQGLTDLSSGYQFEKGNQMTGNALASILQHYTLNADGSLTPKTKTV